MEGYQVGWYSEQQAESDRETREAGGYTEFRHIEGLRTIMNRVMPSPSIYLTPDDRKVVVPVTRFLRKVR